MKNQNRNQALRKRFVLLGGFGGNQQYLSPLAETLSNNKGPLGEVAAQDVDVFTLSDTFLNPERVMRAAKGASLILHSGSIGPVFDNRIMAEGAVLLNTVEKNHLVRDTLMGAPKIAFDRRTPLQPGISAVPFSDFFQEVMRTPVDNLRLPFRLARAQSMRNSSALMARSMLVWEGVFNDGVTYVQGSRDYFGFGKEFDWARGMVERGGGVAVLMDGSDLTNSHNAALVQPEAYLLELTGKVDFGPAE